MRTFLRILTFVLVGPAVGTLTFIIGTSLYTWVASGKPDDLIFALTHVLFTPPIIVFGYILGAPCALLAGIAASVLARRMTNGWRYRGWVTLAGAIAGVIGTTWLATRGFGDGSAASVPAFLAMTALTGAVSALVSTLVFDGLSAWRQRAA